MCPHLVGTLVEFVDKSLITNVGDDLHYVNKDCAKLHVGENSPTTRLRLELLAHKHDAI